MSHHATARLRVKDLALEAGPLRLCEHLSFDIRSGAGLIIRGPNGAGKTTLLRAIAGLGRIAQGSINFGTPSEPEAYRLAENCHYLGHQHGLKTMHTVRQNLSFFARFEASERQSSLSIDEAAHALDITPLLDLSFSVLSAGQMRRAALARLLITQRAVWLLDEPSAALDAYATETVEALSAAHLDAGGMIIASTHLPFLSADERCQTLDISDYAPKAGQEVRL